MIWLLWMALAPIQDGTATIPLWVEKSSGQVQTFELPGALAAEPAARPNLRYAILHLDSAWPEDPKSAAFKIKAWIVALKSANGDARIGLEGPASTIDALMAHELAPYIDGYAFVDEPYIPDADATGKLWQRLPASPRPLLADLLDAASIGIELVILEDVELTQQQRHFLMTVAQTSTGSLDAQPQIPGLDSDAYHLFMNPSDGQHHLALSLGHSDGMLLTLRQNTAFKVKPLFPADAKISSKAFGDTRTEIRIPPGVPYAFLELTPTREIGPTESMRIVEKKAIDPYELVVKNQVFKDTQANQFESLQVEEDVTYRYQGPSGAGVDITFKDTVIQRSGLPTERLRNEMYIGGVKWPYEDLLEMPLIQPEKVQREPMEIDLDKSYRYTYLGDDEVNGAATWKVGFEPKTSGDFFSGTVWIDQKTGAHHKIRAVQSGLEPPVIGNEITAFYDWVEDQGSRYWTQVRERNLMVVNFIGETIPIQLDTQRSDFKFNRAATEQVLTEAYAGSGMILRDTPEGYKYVVKKDGERQLENNPFTRQKFLLGGVIIDPGLEYPIPLAGFNYLNLDFMDRGYQVNALIAGALNVVHFSNNDVFEKGLDFTAELFTTAIYFGDDVYIDGKRRDELEVKELREALNLSLGIPLSNNFKLSANYSLRYLDYKDGDETNPEFVIPVNTFENIGRVSLRFHKARFVSKLEYETVKRTDWESWGLPEDNEPVFDSYSKIQFDASITHRLKRFQTLNADVRYIKGWDLDRFSSIRFGGFENSVAGFGTTGIQADRAVRLRTEYEFGVKELFQMDLSLDGARAWQDEGGSEPVDLVGIGLAANFVGPWKLLLRANLGYGIYSSNEGEEGDITGQIFLLRIF